MSSREIIYDDNTKPNPFVKPTRFSVENEYRVAFIGMKEDCTDITVDKFPAIIRGLSENLDKECL